ncbi:MAG: YddF family protein [Patescibacteria group bacterium]|nr:YddF family protein [Patescibacteria group bacterium]
MKANKELCVFFKKNNKKFKKLWENENSGGEQRGVRRKKRKMSVQDLIRKLEQYSEVAEIANGGVSFFAEPKYAYEARDIVFEYGAPVYWVDDEEVKTRKEDGEHFTCIDFWDYGHGQAETPFEGVYWSPVGQELYHLNENEEPLNTVRSGKVYVLNSPILTSFGKYEYNELTLEEAKTKLQSSEIISAIGHQSTADAISALTEVDVPMNRATVNMKSGEEAIVIKVNGRLPEGKVLSKDELNSIGFTFGLLVKTSD